MKKINAVFILYFLLSLLAIDLIAQPFLIGRISTTIVDPARPTRNIGVEIYYPATTAGTNAPFAQGEFPVIVIGHGFSMNYDSYSNFWNYFTPKGYILVLPTTESALGSANHPNFSADLNYCVDFMQLANADSQSPFFGKVKNKTAIMGHSMGGGCSFVAAGTGNPNITTILGLASAETSVSAIGAAANITIPALLFAGGNDRVTPYADNIGAMYNALQSDCKNIVTITNGSHCQFAESNFACNFGEGSVCVGCSFVARATQHQKVFQFMEPWVDFYLKEDCNAWNVLESRFDTVSGVTHERACNYSLPIASIVANGNTEFCPGGDVTLTGTSSSGNYDWSNGETTQDITVGISDSYMLNVVDQYNCTATSGVIDVTVFQPDAAGILSSTGSSLCGGNSTLSLTNSFQNYLWSTGETTATIEVDVAGNYSVTAIDQNNCESVSDNYNISDVPDPQILVSGSANFCDGDIVTLTVDGNFDTYTWNTGETTQSIEVTGNDTYSVLVDDGNGCTNSTSENVSFNTVPNIPVINQKDDSLFISPVLGTIEWFYEGNTFSFGANIIKAGGNGEYTVVVTENGCSAVSNPFDYFLVSVKDIVTKAISVYPNPATSMLNITAERISAIALSDISGKVLISRNENTNTTTLDMSMLASGNYILTVRTGNEISITRVVKY